MDPLSDAYAVLLDLARDGVASAAWGPHADEAGFLYEELTDAFEGLAHCNALLHFDADQVRADFTYAAGARRQYLQLCARDGARPPEHALSRTHALFCAIAARDAALTADLVRLGPTAWAEGAEYEDDFCYHAAVARLAVPTADALPPLDALLARLLAVGGPSPRLDAVRALADGDATAFRAAFLARLDERALFRDDLYDRRRDQPLFLTGRHVFTEGLALLTLAEARGIAMPDAYAYCPEVARLRPAPPVRDLFADLVPFLRASRVERGLPA